jgi:hypothetical protein
LTDETVFCFLGLATLCLRIGSILIGTDGYLYVGTVELQALMTVLLIFVNLAYAHRIIRGQHPVLGLIATAGFALLYFLMLFAICVLLAGVGQPYFSLDPQIVYNDRAFRIYAWSFFAVVSLLPIIFVGVSSCLPSRRREAGTYTQAWLLAVGTILVALQVWYVAGVEWVFPVSRFLPIPDWMTRSWYYIMIWTIDVLVIFLYAGARGPSRFGGGRRRGATGPGGAFGAGGGRRASTGGRKGRFGLGALAAGAGAGAAAGALIGRRRRNRSEKEVEAEEAARAGHLDRDVDDDDDVERAPTPGPRLATPPRVAFDFFPPPSPPPPLPSATMSSPPQFPRPLPPPMATQAHRGVATTTNTMTGAANAVSRDAVPSPRAPVRKEVRGFDAETIPEVSEEESDSLYGIDSAMGSDSKRHSIVSAPELEKPH